MLAHTDGAALIVLAGSPRSLVELMDIGRSGMASSLVTRAAAGASVVHANAVAHLYANRVRTWLVLLLVVLGLCVVTAAIATTPMGQEWWDHVRQWLDDASASVRERL
jgi:uncharacterized membrane-anchored protein